MATDNWNVSDGDAADQATPVSGEDEAAARIRLTDEADEGDSIEQAHEVPEDDEYRGE